MLKIERKSRKANIYVGIKEKSRIMTPTFLAAFGLALFLHLAGILLFQITPFKLRHADLIFRPVQVNIDYFPQIDSGVLAELENEAPARPQISEPASSEPKIFPLGKTIALHEPAFPNRKNTVDFPFQPEHFRSYISHFINLGTPSFSKNDPFIIRLSGDLSNKRYTLKEIDRGLLPLPAENGKVLRKIVVFKVKVENRTGKIFWMESSSLSGRKKFLRLGEKLLANLQFEKSERGVSTEGVVEIEFIGAQGGEQS